MEDIENIDFAKIEQLIEASLQQESKHENLLNFNDHQGINNFKQTNERIKEDLSLNSLMNLQKVESIYDNTYL